MNHRTHLPDEYRHPPRSSAIAVRTTPRPADSHADWPRHAAAAGHDGLVAEPIDEYLRSAVAALPTPSDIAAPGPDDPVRPGTDLTARAALDLFDAQLASRHLDLAARWLRARGQGFYTIGSSGHESNAAVAAALRPTDPALLHYRSGGFFLARARQVGGSDPVARRSARPRCRDHRDRSRAGGTRCSADTTCAIIPPDLHRRLAPTARGGGGVRNRRAPRTLALRAAWPADAITVCSFGDASANHSTAVGAINTALHTAYQGVPLPLLFVCEDNGIGISTRTPTGWVDADYAQRPRPRVLRGRRLRPGRARLHRRAQRRRVRPRERRKPAFLHLHTVRLMGHAGSDVESAYRSAAEIAADYDRDPLLGTARLLVERGLLRPGEVLDRYEARACRRPRHRAERSRPAAARQRARVMRRCRDARRDVAGDAPVPPAAVRLAARSPTTADLTLAQAINRALLDVLPTYPEASSSARTSPARAASTASPAGCRRRFGPARVFDTLLDEQAILGLALGAGLSGLLPIPEIQYLAYLHNAADQIRGEARDPAVLLATRRTATRWWCASPATATRRASAVTSTTTTPSRRCATSPASSSPPRRGPTTPRRCCAPARPRPGRRSGVRVPRTDRALPHPRPLHRR